MRIPVIVVVFLLCAGVAHGQAPQAKLRETGRDSGTVFVGSSVKGTIVVENIGTVPFSIVQAKTSCHCTTAIPSKSKIEPGKTGEVLYEMDSASPARRSINISIMTDPPLPEPLVFTATATFAPYIVTEQTDLVVELPQGQTLSHTVPLKLAEGVEGLKIVGVTTRSRDLNVALDDRADGGKDLVFTGTGPLQPGKRSVRATVQYEMNGSRAQDIVLTVDVLPVIRVTPSPVVVKFEEGATEATVPVAIKNTKEQPIAVRSLTAQLCTIRDVELPKQAATEFTIPVTFLKQAERAPRRGVLVFDFGDEIGKQNVYVVFSRDFGKLPPVQRAPQSTVVEAPAPAPAAGTGQPSQN